MICHVFPVAETWYSTTDQTDKCSIYYFILFYFQFYSFSSWCHASSPERKKISLSLSLSRPRSKCYSTCFYCSIWSPVPSSLPWIMDGSVVGLRNPFISGSHAFIFQFQTWSHSTCTLVVLFNPKIFGELIDSIHGHELKGD